MKIYFYGSIRAGRDDQEWYQRLIQSLQYHGQVLTEHVGDPNLTQWGDEGPAATIMLQQIGEREILDSKG